MPADPIFLESAIAPALRYFALNGGAAGDHTVTGIEVGDKIHAVLHFTITAGNFTALDVITSEFTVTAANTINNAGGTSTTGDRLLVIYSKHEVQN
ncbi:MAG: hypothetical protein GTO63_30270 [Anaerolineae bacterium]|nr:hypothetical protein [Anaerolineae bacterium]NIN98991.1 hypothetical protein [Anaerolineae bacterium]